MTNTDTAAVTASNLLTVLRDLAKGPTPGYAIGSDWIDVYRALKEAGAAEFEVDELDHGMWSLTGHGRDVLERADAAAEYAATDEVSYRLGAPNR